MNIIYTIYGTLTPDMIANAGNTFCQKPPPPGQTCAITVPSVIDHELIKTTDHSVVAIDGTVNCGAAPLLEIIGGGKINLAPGLYTLITPEMIGEDRIRLTSTLTAIKAEPGDYAGIAIVIASPY
ncbi:hypothetical protein QZQ97_22785 [Serratia sp. root2]|uniref:hypothetical protein n=1 Tax=Serratia sp. root2 TaxID=3059676 RepID=UPI0028922AED|nr:hypothetical protein [Serratia sp. root2]MDT3253743.1 hypothetical protein [Serratia sp. root2]